MINDKLELLSMAEQFMVSKRNDGGYDIDHKTENIGAVAPSFFRRSRDNGIFLDDARRFFEDTSEVFSFVRGQGSWYVFPDHVSRSNRLT